MQKNEEHLTDFYLVVFSGYHTAMKYMYTLTNMETGEIVCSIGKKDLQFLIKHLDGEFEEGEEYLLTNDELEQLEMYDIGEDLCSALRKALDEPDKVTLVWSRD